jgi:SAM-dependent methyltransferase
MCVRFPLRFVSFVALAIRFRGFIIEVAGIGSTFRPYLRRKGRKISCQFGNLNYLIKCFEIMGHNSVLKNSFEVYHAMKCLRSLGLFPHHDTVKSWDTLKMVDIIKQADRSAFILDAGCNGSPILPLLRRLGFMNLYGCDLLLKEEISPAIELYKTFHISIQDLEKTEYQNNTFDFVTSLSVIEHGINIQNYFKEMSRIIKKDGLLLTSTDYWPDKIVNLVNTDVNPKNSPDNIFSRREIEEDVIRIAERNGFLLNEAIDFTYEEKVIHWNDTCLDYTFIFFTLRKN